MPKITNKEIRIYTDGADVSYNFQINYNTIHKFYAKMPASFEEYFQSMDEDQRRNEGLFDLHRWDNKRKTWLTPALKAETEDLLVQNLEKILTDFCNSKSVKKDVIVIMFHDESDSSREEKYSKLSMKFTYTPCTEVTIGGKDPKYYTYDNYEAFGEVHTSRQEVTTSFWRNKALIIDSTPENLAFLEKTHKALSMLIKSLTKFTASKEAFSKLVNSEVKLLSF